MAEDKKEIRLISERWGTQQVEMCHKTGRTQKGDIAWELISKYGLIAGTPDGVDAAGRAIVIPMPVEEVVDRACEMAEEIWAQFERRGWFQELPIPPVHEQK